MFDKNKMNNLIDTIMNVIELSGFRGHMALSLDCVDIQDEVFNETAVFWDDKIEVEPDIDYGLITYNLHRFVEAVNDIDYE